MVLRSSSIFPSFDTGVTGGGIPSVGGGFTLARPPGEIRLGDIVRLGEETETVIECMDKNHRPCRIAPACRLKGVLDEAAAAFFKVLDGYSLADLVRQPAKLRAVLGL